MSTKKDDKLPGWGAWLGLKEGLSPRRVAWLGPMASALLAVVGVVTVGTILIQLGKALLLGISVDVRNYGLLLSGVIGAGLVGWRNAVAARQAALQDESLFNDKINAAAADLATQRQVTTVLGEKDNRTVLTEWEDDVVTRCAAIDRLEGLAHERPSETPRIARMLSVYVRELSKQDGLRAKDHPREEWLSLRDKGLSAEEIEAQHGITEEEASSESFRAWAGSLTPIRSDMEKAAQTLGRLQDIRGYSNLNLDMRSANLQGFDLTDLNFSRAQMDKARLEGALLKRSKFENVRFTESDLSGLSIVECNLKKSIFRRAKMRNSFFYLSDFTETDFSYAEVSRSSISSSTFVRASLFAANCDYSRFAALNFEETDLRFSELSGSDLRRINFNSADLSYFKLDNETKLESVTLRNARIKGADLSQTAISPYLFESLFGDASVNLPFNNPNWWPDIALNDTGGTRSPFHIEYAHWLSSPDTYDWSRRRQFYTDDGHINLDKPPPEYLSDD